jgi:hypothetical protein
MRLSKVFFALFVLGAAIFWLRWVGPVVQIQKLPDTTKEPNQKIVVDEQGRKVFELRWPHGSADKIVKLRIPVEYAWLSGMGAAAGLSKALGPDYQDPNVTEPYIYIFNLEVALPSFEPQTKSNKHLFEMGKNKSVALISIYGSTLEGMSIYNEPMVHTIFKGQIEKMKEIQNSYSGRIKFEQKPNLFGLNRYGPVGDVEYVWSKTVYVHEYYYPDNEQKTYFIECIVKHSNETEEHIKSDRGNFCTHYYQSKYLKGRVRLHYTQNQIKDWAEIQRKTEELISSFQILRPLI